MVSISTEYRITLTRLSDSEFRGYGLSGSYLQTEAVDDGVFEVGETVTVTYPGGDFAYEVLGTSSGGWVGYSAALGQYHLFSDSQDAWGTTITLTPQNFATCFLEGTRIATPAGEVPIEALRIGDLVLTADGRACALRWIGRQSVVTVFADRARQFPIRIQAGALGGGLPRRDLCVSPDHALFLDGLLVQAGALVNGGSIRQVERPAARFTYFHLELAEHALVLAEGTPAESFVDNVTRARFDNHAEYVALHGAAEAPTGELAAPRVKSARQLPRHLRARLSAADGSGIAAA